MAGFLYYIENLNGASADDTKRLGIDHAFNGESFERCNIEGGPNSGKGILIARPEAFVEKDEQGRVIKTHKIGYYPKEQEWISCNGKFWLGWYRDSKPKPENLIRASRVRSYPAQLTDKNTWYLPIATALPSYLGMDYETGKRTRKTKTEYKLLSEYGDKVFRQYQSQNHLIDEHYELSDDESFAIAEECLRTNYFISSYEIDVLQLLDTVNLAIIFFSLIDCPKQGSFDENKKKESSDSTY